MRKLTWQERMLGTPLLMILVGLSSALASRGAERSRGPAETKTPDDPLLAATYPLNLDTPYPGAGGRLRLTVDDLVVAEGAAIHLLHRTDEGWHLRATFENGSEVLDLQEWAVRYQVLALDRSGVKVIDLLSFEEPRLLGEYRIDNRNLASPGHFVERFGSYAYVVDAATGGFKVVDLDRPAAPALISEFSGTSGLPVGLRIHDGNVYLLSSGELTAVRVGEFLDPRPELAGRLATSGAAALALTGSHGFLAEGARLSVVRLDAQSPAFLTREGSYEATSAIGQLVARDGRMYVVGPDGATQVLDIAAYER